MLLREKVSGGAEVYESRQSPAMAGCLRMHWRPRDGRSGYSGTDGWVQVDVPRRPRLCYSPRPARTDGMVASAEGEFEHRLAVSSARGHPMTTDPYAEQIIPLPRLRTISQLWTLAAVLGGLGVAALAIDVPVAAWTRGGHAPDFVEKICGLAEVFGHGLGVVLIVIVIGVLDPWHRYGIPRIMAASLGAGLSADVIKLLVARTRPNHCDFAIVDRGIETFGSWFPLAGNASWEQSFPSSHMATAAGLAIVLAAFYPRGRWLFPAFAALAGMQRVLHQSHFPSDIFWGAAVGCIFAPLCVYGSRLSQTFDRLEAFLIARAEQIARSRKPGRSASGPSQVGANPMDRAGAA